MFECNRFETGMIMSGNAHGVIRKFHGECPIKVGDEIVFVSQYLDNSGRKIPFGMARVIAVQPGSFGEFKRNKMIIEMDGYPNSDVMQGNLSSFIGPIKDVEKVYHIQFRMSELDQKAGKRPDVNNSKVETVDIDGVVTKMVREE